ncbi:hypothetical protein BN85314380 [Paracholeplasma brassicae]|jgi:hypothetical protein|uniref:DUF1858 domain-containing protein n=1 Tax=Acholeplasma brassicae TaxID=61635 RepID=U4KTC7_9MOLU|nr:DUF1858 domain-containing protein [Paracholeplasma brassicae]CCV66459.1 hypothetical protein BN85314380 [Paracholeplasma brassicae]
MEIDLNEKIIDLVKKDEKIKDILSELGFSEITKPGMIQTVGRFMSINQGSSLRKIDIEVIKERFKSYGYQIKGDLNE